WCVSPRDAKANRERVASLVPNDIRSDGGIFPDKEYLYRESVKETKNDVTRIKITGVWRRKLCPFLNQRLQ
ncbi:hypothetical protein QQ73_00665, partial [Candidatus Endoriftia persephone str. Guaymas]|nr:hypothetical protein [Candidatus Endoriftia persephone str. Guaymas]